MGFAFLVLTLVLLLSLNSAQARYDRPSHTLRHEGHRLPPLPRLSRTYNGYHQRNSNGSACIQAPPAEIRAPKQNVWAALTYEEVVQVRQWLYDQRELNLSSGYGYADGTFLGKIELNAPNKTDVLPYLDGSGLVPQRYAKTQTSTYNSDSTVVQVILVGPLPVDETTTWQPLGYPYSRKDGRIVSHDSNPNFGFHSAYEFSKQLKDGAQDVFAGLWPQLNHTWSFRFQRRASPPKVKADILNGIRGVGWEWPLGLYYGLELNEKDPENVEFLGWIYNETLYSSTGDLRNALRNGTIQPAKATVAGEWSGGGAHGRAMPRDTMPPPQAVAPAGSRFSLDKNTKYVEWMGFTFYMGFTYNRGWAFYDVRHKGQRILYELSLQEALAHYAGTDPGQSGIYYLDAASGLGGDIVEMVPGYDCPAYARYWNTHASYDNSQGYLINNAVCFFEFDADFPIARHSGGYYVASRKNIYFVVRSVYTVGNYDYMFSYEFYLDGSIKVVVRASGYIAGQSAIGNRDYGYDIHGGLSGGIHDHTLNFKADFDILGTANTMQLTSFVPANEKYLWSTEPLETFKLKREIVASEDKSRLDWNRATQYSIINTDRPNQWGEYRGYRIMPVDGTTHFTNKKSASAKNLIHPFTFDLGITKFKDTEPQSTDPNDDLDSENPLVSFDDFFNSERLEQEDIVTWINLGMHHLPHTGDLPFTLFTTAHASVQFQPLNYYYDDISTESLSQVEIDFTYTRNATSESVKTFGQNPAWCSIDLSKDAPDIYAAEKGYVGYY